MKKIAVCACACALILITIVSCHKNNSGPYPGSGPNSLWPLKAGNTWYYEDSVFSPAGVTGHYPDTIVENGQIIQDGSGTYYMGINNAAGWFGIGSYLSVDPTNYAIYEVDSPAFSPYIFFQTVGQDGVTIGTGSDYSNPACPVQSVQYGFSTPKQIGSYSSLENIQYVTDCNNITREAIATYISPGVGLVRIEDYLADTANNNKLYLTYSQTLKSQTLH
jgi:hypothetical protein